MCKELMLIIEVDEISHSFDEVAKRDEQKQQALEKAGFTVLRFNDEDILSDITL